jgi:uncharacterized membrane protein
MSVALPPGVEGKEFVMPAAPCLAHAGAVEPIEQQSAQLASTLPVPAGAAYTLFADPTRIPEWLSVVHSARVLVRRLGRATRVAFLARMDRASIGYSLDYRYDDARLAVAWSTASDASIRVAGSALFEPLGARACLMRYRLELRTPRLARWIDPFFDSHAGSAVVHDFREYLRRTGGF